MFVQGMPCTEHHYDDLKDIEATLSKERKCEVCKSDLPSDARATQRFCSSQCRNRFGVLRQRIARLRRNASLFGDDAVGAAL